MFGMLGKRKGVCWRHEQLRETGWGGCELMIHVTTLQQCWKRRVWHIGRATEAIFNLFELLL
eukprot:scaffold161237_cov22-Tisochrysis_lutea.AAC.1